MFVNPFSRRALAAVLYTLVALPFALLGFVLTLVGLVVGGVLSVTSLGPWLLALCVRGALALGAGQRRLAAGLLGETIERPVRRHEPGAFGWRRAVLGDQVGWRAVGAALIAPLTVIPPAFAVFVGYVNGLLLPINLAIASASDEVAGVEVGSWPRRLVLLAGAVGLLVLAPWLLRWALIPHRIVLRGLLGPTAAERRIHTLEETRAHAVADAAATLRRIERDLHDGTQARLVALGMQLTMIGELVDTGADQDRVRAVVDTARGNATQAVADLRDLVRGIHPPVLDQGLDPALATLAADSALPVTLTIDTAAATGGRPPPAVESIAYFCAAELLANAAKHSGADEVGIEVVAKAGVLRLTVRDDGRGGAAVGAGSGLRGLLARVRTVDGTLTLDSPSGGPTTVTVELPYG